MSEKWTQAEAIELCRIVESICPDFGCHVALTGGLLYKHGPRKDADILFYRVRQEKIDVDGLFVALALIGIARLTIEEHWCIKASYQGKAIDCFFPEVATGDYGEDEKATATGPGIASLFADADEVSL